MNIWTSGPADAPVLVLTGSLGTELSMWEPQVRALQHRFRVICCDVRGHGGSPVPPGPYTLPELGADVLGVLDRLGVDRAHLCGLSIGAMMSLWVAAHAPARVERLVACCTTARFPPEVAEAYRERATSVRDQGVEAIADGVLERWFTPAFAAARPDVVARFRAGLIGIPPEGYAGCCEALATLDLTADLPDIAAPTLVLSGAEDRATPPEHGRAIADAITGATFDVVAGAAHLASVERAELVTALILRFLTQPEGSPDE